MAEMVSAPKTTSAKQRDLVGRLLVHLVVIILCFLTIFPFFWMISTAFKPANEVFTKNIQLIPLHPTWRNFPDAFQYFPVAHWLWNSFGIAVLTTLGKLAISIPAAFAFSRLRFPGRNIFFALVLATMIVPGVTHIVPNYVLVSRLGWLNTWWAVIIPSLPGTAFYMFLLRQNIMTLPQDLIDAGRVDGASTMKMLWQIVVPNIRPAIAVVCILSFLGAWNQYLWPLLVLNDFNSKTLAVGMQFFTSNTESAQLWGPMMATAAVATVPPLLIFAFAQKQIISTFVSSGIKG
ncbi:MAG TPA: carbohydrate ABC transporter permease [Thermomicrobiales bacterium]|nr:carbohydrate ABC transporter permease [Thermomicrobiales bacterium]